jgi:hypothetical protein
LRLRTTAATTPDAAPTHLEPYQLAAHALRLLFLQSGAADEIALAQFHDPAKLGFKRRNRSVNLVTVKSHFGFQT